MRPILERKFEVKVKLKWKIERSGNNLITIKYSDFYNLLFIYLYNYLPRNTIKQLIEINLLGENEV